MCACVCACVCVCVCVLPPCLFLCVHPSLCDKGVIRASVLALGASGIATKITLYSHSVKVCLIGALTLVPCMFLALCGSFPLHCEIDF